MAIRIVLVMSLGLDLLFLRFFTATPRLQAGEQQRPRDGGERGGGDCTKKQQGPDSRSAFTARMLPNSSAVAC